MELSICVVTFCHLCQLIIDLRMCRMYVSFLALVCLFVVCLFSAFDMKSLSFFEYSRIFWIFNERDISYQKLRTHNRQTNKRTQKKCVLIFYATKNQDEDIKNRRNQNNLDILNRRQSAMTVETENRKRETNTRCLETGAS